MEAIPPARLVRVEFRTRFGAKKMAYLSFWNVRSVFSETDLHSNINNGTREKHTFLMKSRGFALAFGIWVKEKKIFCGSRKITENAQTLVVAGDFSL